MTIPLLEANDIECRVQQVTSGKNGDGAVLLLYKDARTDMRILDLVYGPGNWQRTHEAINGNLFCNIDIWDGDKKSWVRKQDVGVESNAEKEKGQASDSFKRAGFNVGIGRELYTAPFIYIFLDPDEVTTNKAGKKAVKSHVRFSVSHIAYNDRREITELVITDGKADRYTYGVKGRRPDPKPAPMPAPEPKPAPEPEKPSDPLDNVISCEWCDSVIWDYEGNNGKTVTAKRHAKASMEKYGKVLCLKCIKAMAV